MLRGGDAVLKLQPRTGEAATRALRYQGHLVRGCVTPI